MGVNQTLKTSEIHRRRLAKGSGRASALGRAVEALLLGAGGGSLFTSFYLFYEYKDRRLNQLLAVFVGRDLH